MKSIGLHLNRVDMTKDDILDSYQLLPCREDESDGDGGDTCSLKHSISGWFEVENTPLRINTVCFIGSHSRLKSQLKRREGICLADESGKLDESFKGNSGLTFMLNRPDGSSLVVIWMPKFDWSILDIETLSHECLHASVMVMRESGSRPKIFTANKEVDVDDEGLCYRQSKMLTDILKRMVVKQNSLFKKGLG